MSSISNIAWIGPLVLVLTRFAVSNARFTRVNRDGANLVFRAGPMVRNAVDFGCVLFAVLLSRAIGHEETWVVVLGSVMLVALCLAYPATYICAPSALIRQLWWKPKLKLEWQDIVQVEHTRGGDLYVYDRTGRRLCFTRFHVDPETFESVVLRRAGIDRVIEGSEPSTIK